MARCPDCNKFVRIEIEEPTDPSVKQSRQAIKTAEGLRGRTMSYIEGNRIQCDQCGPGSIIPVPFLAGVIILQEIPDQPMRTAYSAWPQYHFHNLDELKAWLPDTEQIIKIAPVIPPRTQVRRATSKVVVGGNGTPTI